MDSVVILGSTGSIGVNTLNICRRFDIEVEALVAGGNNIELFQKQINEFKPKFVAIPDRDRAKLIEHPNLFTGEDATINMLKEVSSPLVVNSLVGYAGLAPTLEVLRLKKRLALANKESLVVAGAFIDKSNIIPIDSEHFGLWYLFNDRVAKRLIITASGGAFRDWDIKDIYQATYRDALKHPNWSMGAKITIDSASMMNKLFEVLEAKWLFGIDNIDAYIERKSVIHALIEFIDGSTTAHLAGVDMKLPIAFALRGVIEEEIIPPLNLLEIGEIKFEEIESSKYRLWSLKDEILKNPKSGVVLNSANEVAMKDFIRGDISFGQMIDKIIDIYDRYSHKIPKEIDEVFEIDREIRGNEQ